MNFFIASASFYPELQEKLTQAAVSYLNKSKISFQIGNVDGALELASLILEASQTKNFDAFIALATVLKGETYHFEIVANHANYALTKIMIDNKLIIGNGILTCYNLLQANERSKPNKTNKGYLAAKAAHNLCLASLKLRQNL